MTSQFDRKAHDLQVYFDTFYLCVTLLHDDAKVNAMIAMLSAFNSQLMPLMHDDDDDDLPF